MGWQKRGKGHNYQSGHAAAMSLTTGKVLDYTTKIKACRYCDAAKKQVDHQKIMTAEKTTQVHQRLWRLLLQWNFSKM